MPVVVIGASGFVGRHAVPAFARVSPEVRAYVQDREAAEELRTMGAKVAVGLINDVDTLGTAMDGAHTVCHLDEYRNAQSEQVLEDLILGSIRPVLIAAFRAGIRRVLYLSVPRAESDASNAVLSLKGQAEEAIRASGLEFAIVRRTITYGPGSDWLERIYRRSRRWEIGMAGSGKQIWAPVFVEDVAAVLVAADDRHALRSGVWGLEGPDRVSAEAFYRMVAGRRVRVHHSPFGFSPLSNRHGWPIRALTEMAAGDSLADAPDASAEFGIERTPLVEGLLRWRASLGK